MPIDTPAYFPNAEQLPRQLRDGLRAALDGLKAAELASIAGRLVSDAQDDPQREIFPRAGEVDKANPGDQTLDLVTLVYPRELDRARLRSLMAESLAACDPSSSPRSTSRWRSSARRIPRISRSRSRSP